MNTIRSGASRERIVRTAVLFVLLAGYAAWSLWDGYVAYPRANVRAVFEDVLGIAPPDLRPRPQQEVTSELNDEFEVGDSFGGKAARINAQGYWNEAGDTVVYPGPIGFVRVSLQRGEVIQHEWIEGPKYSPTSITLQKWIGALLIPFALGVLARLIRIGASRAVLTADALKIPGQGPVSLDAISDVRDGEYRDTYWIEYDDGGLQRTIMLDGYKVREAPAMAEEIRKRLRGPSMQPDDGWHKGARQ